MLGGCTPYPPEFVERYVRAGYWRSETIPQAVAAVAARVQRRHPVTIAIADSVRRRGYGELIGEASRFAGVLDHHGLKRGDRIVIQLPNCTEFASLLLACLEIGALPVMALPAFRRAELEYLVSFAGARAIAIASEYRGFDHATFTRQLRTYLPGLETIFSTGPSEECVWLHQNVGEARPIGSHPGDPLEVALFLLSGGTTGLPKLIPRTHADYIYNALESATASQLEPGARILLALPAEHNFPLACPGLLGALLVGATAVFAPSTDARAITETIEREQITHLPCVPAIALSLLELPASARSALRSLRVITVGGQRLQEPTARALQESLPDLFVQQVFGMAEGLVCCTRIGDSEDVKFTTQGRPLSPADEIRVVREDGTATDSPGELGELLCRGPYTIRGYFRAPERNREAFTPDGFYRTGDLVRRHPSGNLVVEGRIKDMINRGGEKVSAEEVESHLLAHPAILRASVVAMPDPKLGERACAYVTLRAEAHIHLEEIRAFLFDRGVARFKWPERIEVLNEMPMTNVGKIQKSALRLDIETKLKAE